MPFSLGWHIDGVWSRHSDPELVNKHDELFDQLSVLTGSPFKSHEWDVVDCRQTGEEDKYQCICSCYQLQTLYVVQHRPSGIRASVGSSCIHQFDNKQLSKDLNALMRGNRCKGGKIIPDMRTSEGRKGLCDEYFCACKGYRTCDRCGNHYKDFCETCFCRICRKIECTCKKCERCNAIVDQDWKRLCTECFIGKMKCQECDTMIPKSKFKLKCITCWRMSL